MENFRLMRVAAAFVAVLTTSFCATARAQFVGGAAAGVEAIPGIGADQSYINPNGGVPIQEEIKIGARARPIMRPSIPSGQSFSTTFSFDSWGNQTQGDVTRIRGDRVSAIFGYTRGLPGNAEVAVLVPEQRLHLDGLGEGRGLGDIMAVVRKYAFDPENVNEPTIVYSLRVFAPTGSQKRGLGLGKLSGGLLLSVSKPLGETTLGYLGSSYTVIPGTIQGIDTKNLLSAWAGGVTTLKPRVGLQYELSYFNSMTAEKFVRLLIGPSYALTPTRTLQLNYLQELKAAASPRSVSLGFSTQF